MSVGVRRGFCGEVSTEVIQGQTERASEHATRDGRGNSWCPQACCRQLMG